MTAKKKIELSAEQLTSLKETFGRSERPEMFNPKMWRESITFSIENVEVGLKPRGVAKDDNSRDYTKWTIQDLKTGENRVLFGQFLSAFVFTGDKDSLYDSNGTRKSEAINHGTTIDGAELTKVFTFIDEGRELDKLATFEVLEIELLPLGDDGNKRVPLRMMNHYQQCLDLLNSEIIEFNSKLGEGNEDDRKPLLRYLTVDSYRETCGRIEHPTLKDAFLQPGADDAVYADPSNWMYKRMILVPVKE